MVTPTSTNGIPDAEKQFELFLSFRRNLDAHILIMMLIVMFPNPTTWHPVISEIGRDFLDMLRGRISGNGRVSDLVVLRTYLGNSDDPLYIFNLHASILVFILAGASNDSDLDVTIWRGFHRSIIEYVAELIVLLQENRFTHTNIIDLANSVTWDIPQ
jgi:hypothetical protein